MYFSVNTSFFLESSEQLFQQKITEASAEESALFGMISHLFKTKIKKQLEPQMFQYIISKPKKLHLIDNN